MVGTARGLAMGRSRAWEQVATLFGPVCAAEPEHLQEEARAAGPGWGQDRRRAGGPDPCTLGSEHATASIGQRLPDLDVATPNVEPMEKARQE